MTLSSLFLVVSNDIIKLFFITLECDMFDEIRRSAITVILIMAAMNPNAAPFCPGGARRPQQAQPFYTPQQVCLYRGYKLSL